MKGIGIILVILGLIGFALGGFSYTTEEEVLDLGELEVETEETQSVQIPPLASGAAVAVGLALIVAGSMKPGADRT